MSDQHERSEVINDAFHQGDNTKAGFVALIGAPNAGKWGMGRDGDDRFKAIYGNASNAATAMLGSTIYTSTNKTGYRTQVLYIVDAGNTIIAKTRIAYVPRTILALGLTMGCATM